MKNNQFEIITKNGDFIGYEDIYINMENGIKYDTLINIDHKKIDPYCIDYNLYKFENKFKKIEDNYYYIILIIIIIVILSI